MTILLLAMLLLTLLPAGEPPVGFIWHYPFVDVGTEQVPRSGATEMIARAPWVVVQPEEGRFDLSPLDLQIAAAERGGYRLTLLLECNPFCAPPWLREKARAAGEMVADVDGRPGPVPRIDSPVFCAAQERFMRAVIKHVRQADRRRVVVRYQAGIEWWFPYSERHAPADVARFRAWLQRRYRAVAALNAAWSAGFPTFDAVEPPRLTVGDLWKNGRVGMTPLDRFGPAPGAYRNMDAASADGFAFWFETAAEYINRLAGMVKRLDPTRRTATFQTMAFAFGSEWDYVQWSAVSLDEVARRARDVDDLGMQLCAASGDPYRITVGLDTARKYRKPLFVLDLLDFTDGVAAGYARMERATHAAVQHGAAGLFYCCWNGAKDFNFHPDWPIEDLRRMLEDARAAIKMRQGMQVRPEGALILPYVPASPADAAGMKNDVASFMGWYRLMQGTRRTFDVVSLREMENGAADPARYRWILVPDCAYIPVKARDRLAAFHRKGGCLIVSGRYAQRDPAGRPLPEAAAPAGELPYILPDWGRDYAGPLVREARAGDTPPLIQWRPETPAFARIRRQAEDRLRAVFRQAGLPSAADLMPSTPAVTCVRYEGRGTVGYYLVNMADTPAEGLRLRVAGARGDGAAVFADARTARADVRSTPSGVEVRLPPFRAACFVKLRAAR